MADVIETLADGTVTERDFTKAELDQIKADKAANAERVAKIKELATAKAAAQAKLAALGLTVEDLQALGL
jgi:hypothetical protein